MTTPLVVGIGEFLWDHLPSGPRMGGAPANFACHAAALGARAAVISAVGADASGERLLASLASFGVDCSGIAAYEDLPTSTVGVTLDGHGQPAYVIHSPAAWDRIPAGDAQRALVSAADVICFGTLAQRAPDGSPSFRTLLASAAPGALIILDVNLRPPFYDAAVLGFSLDAADVVKLNEDELHELVKLFGLDAGGMLESCESLRRRFDLSLIACTRGSRGCLLWDGRESVQHPGLPVAAVDSVGAGDSFTAALAIGLLQGRPLPEIAAAANEVAAFVCSHPGAVPALPPHLRGLFAAPSSSTSRLAV